MRSHCQHGLFASVRSRSPAVDRWLRAENGAQSVMRGFVCGLDTNVGQSTKLDQENASQYWLGRASPHSKRKASYLLQASSKSQTFHCRF